MGKQAFTPGDWEASGPFVRTPLVANSRGGCDGGFAVAAIHPNVNGADVAARLMAAAPEGYALAEAIERLASSPLQHDYVPVEIQELAKTLLAKARGIAA